MILAIAACNGGGGGGNGNGSDNTGAVPKGNRVLEIQSSEPADGDFAGAFNLAQTVGMESASLAQDWNDIDIGTDNSTVPPSPIYADDPDTDFLTIANSCYPNSNTKLSLLLRPITTLIKMAPPGFENVPFDDPAMIERFKAFLDHVFSKIPDLEITALAIGSEVDLYLLTTDLQDEYLSFYEAVSEYARAAYTQLYPAKPLLNVAVEVTHKGLLDPGSRAYYQQLNAFSDVTPMIDSTAKLQADFIEAVFDAWDDHARIDLISFTWMHDETEADVADITANPAFGGTSNPSPDLVEFLRTLGLRTDAAVDKPAWRTLAKEAAARGWSDTGFELTCN